MIKRFPLPQSEQIEQHKEQINKLTGRLWENMKKVFDEDKHYFYTAFLRSLLEEVVDLLANFYDLSEEQVIFIKEYDSKYIW